MDGTSNELGKIVKLPPLQVLCRNGEFNVGTIRTKGDKRPLWWWLLLVATTTFSRANG
jgi:hypothetical protein